jgi:hypothetical protein
VSIAEVLALAAAWERCLDDAQLAALRARALELGVRDGAERVRALRDQVIDELVELAALADGPLPAAALPGPFGGELARRLRERLIERVDRAVAALLGKGLPAPTGPLETWERWLTVRTAIDDVEARAGSGALSALWYGGVRDAVWGASSALFNAQRAPSAWVAHMMFTWVADRGEMLGDFSASLANRENARNALGAA